MSEHRQQRLAEFVGWARAHVRGDEKGEAQIFLDRLFQAFGWGEGTKARRHEGTKGFGMREGMR